MEMVVMNQQRYMKAMKKNWMALFLQETRSRLYKKLTKEVNKKLLKCYVTANNTDEKSFPRRTLK